MNKGQNRREFLTKFGVAAVLPIIPQLAKGSITPTDLPDISYVIGLYESEFFETQVRNLHYSIFLEARRFNNEPDRRIISAALKPMRGAKLISITYLEPTAEEYPAMQGE